MQNILGPFTCLHIVAELIHKLMYIGIIAYYLSAILDRQPLKSRF